MSPAHQHHHHHHPHHRRHTKPSIRNPKSLYSMAVVAMAKHVVEDTQMMSPLTDDMKLDVFLHLQKESRRFDILHTQLSRPFRFIPLLELGSRRTELHALVQAVKDAGRTLHEDLTRSVVQDLVQKQRSDKEVKMYSNKVLNLATFFLDSGWYQFGSEILQTLLCRLDHIRGPEEDDTLFAIKFECSTKLLHSLSSFCRFEEAQKYYEELLWTLSQALPTWLRPHQLATCYSQFSAFCFVKSQYLSSYKWSMEAVKLLSSEHPPKVVVDVLRQASKACVVRRCFSKAEILITDAVLLAKEVFGENHPKYADCLTDYGFYLLNVDSVAKSMQAYESALEVRSKFLGCQNLLVAFSHEDLAYASYVKEYSSGHFKRAQSHAQKSLEIMNWLLPKKHLLLASSQRVLALILEEIAIDDADKQVGRDMLLQSEQLHLCALDLAIAAFGEMNVQTSKHYGNLGRLYQSMERFDKAETMHKKAIYIKEKLLGQHDYEVALSIGHLASLYNYDLDEFEKAETLYLRSIDIGLNLFGPGYSGLEYDYRGLIRVYQETTDAAKLQVYSNKLREWKALRCVKESQMENSGLVTNNSVRPITTIVEMVTKTEGDEGESIWNEVAEILSARNAESVMSD